MPLISCPSCSKEVSSEAAACPHCGHPLKAQRVQTTEDSYWTRNRGFGDLVVYGVLLFLAALIGFAVFY